MVSAYKLWDWPTRLFHWSLVVIIALSWWTANEGHMDWHERLAYTLLVLLLTRVLWGFVGSHASRFSSFLRGPRTVLAYLKGQVGPGAGHNPLGGWSVMLLLAMLFLQIVSGLFNSDDILFDGPLYHLASSEWQDRMGQVHVIAFDVLLIMIAVHILAVLYHQWRHKQPLIQAMLRGSARAREGLEPTRPGWWAIVIALLVAAALWGLLALVPAPVSYW